jgi:hypothetical protein
MPHSYFCGAYSTRQVTHKEEVLPDDCYPVFGKRYTEGVWVSAADRRDACGVPESMAPGVSTFDKYIDALPEWESDLLRNITPTVDHLHVLQCLSKASSPAFKTNGVGDGSVLDSQGTFGWVLAFGELLLATAVGRAFGDKMDSYRAEAYGLLSVLCYVVHLF